GAQPLQHAEGPSPCDRIVCQPRGAERFFLGAMGAHWLGEEAFRTSYSRLYTSLNSCPSPERAGGLGEEAGAASALGRAGCAGVLRPSRVFLPMGVISSKSIESMSRSSPSRFFSSVARRAAFTGSATRSPTDPRCASRDRSVSAPSPANSFR